MTTNISVTPCTAGYREFSNVWLVRGVGRRSIRVILRMSMSRYRRRNELKIITDAAKFAAKKSWRKIVVGPDSFEGDTIRGFNLHQYYYEEWGKGYIGAFLGFINEY